MHDSIIHKYKLLLQLKYSIIFNSLFTCKFTSRQLTVSFKKEKYSQSMLNN